ncbi:hypothetical protein B0H10DRAFT_463094 [Mycena sp. CBHHK59/15]|nr:hypothetical protein B0H10DRAFT_463094 [Mycena sp. CBHHK59/15]
MPVIHYRADKVVTNLLNTQKTTATVKATTTIVKPAKTTATAKATAKATGTSTTNLLESFTSVIATAVKPVTSATVTSPSLTPARTSSIATSTPITSSSTTTPTLTASTHSKAEVKSPSSASASSSASAAISSTHVPAVAAGIVGGIVGVVVTALIVAFFLRRWNHKRHRKGRESINFNPDQFRRSAVMLQDPHPMGSSAAGSIRSAVMEERHPSEAATRMVAYQYPVTHTPMSPAFYAPPYGSPRDVQQQIYSPYPYPYRGYPPDPHYGVRRYPADTASVHGYGQRESATT